MVFQQSWTLAAGSLPEVNCNSATNGPSVIPGKRFTAQSGSLLHPSRAAFERLGGDGIAGFFQQQGYLQQRFVVIGFQIKRPAVAFNGLRVAACIAHET